jgi:hypothetical protein
MRTCKIYKNTCHPPPGGRDKAGDKWGKYKGGGREKKKM